MSIQNLILGSLVSRGADRLLNPARYDKNLIDKFIVGGGFTGEGSDEDEKDKGPTTFGGIAKQGIMSLLAQAVLGPVLGPLALTLGQNFLDKRREEGLSFSPFGGDGPSGPSGIVANKAITLDGDIVDVGSEEYYDDLDKRDKEFAETGDYDVYSDTVTTGPTQPTFDPNKDYYTGSDEEDKDDEGGATTTTTTSVSDYSPTMQDPDPANGSNDTTTTTSDAPAYDFARGGLASLYR
jgi:hypothetical protein